MKLLFSGIAAIMVFALWTPARAEVSVNITVPLPGLVFPAPPGLIVIPGSYVYYSPDVDVDIFFYQGYWYRPHRGGWYIANGYNGPWRAVGRKRVPRPLLGLPSGHRRASSRHARMPYPEVQRNWRTWEKERHWDGSSKHERKRHDDGRRKHGKRKGGRRHRD